MLQMLALLEMLEVSKINTVIMMLGTNEVFRGGSRRTTKLRGEVELPFAGGEGQLESNDT